MGERKLLCLSSDVAKSLQPNPVWKKVVGFSGNHEEECGAVVEGGRGGGKALGSWPLYKGERHFLGPCAQHLETKWSWSCSKQFQMWRFGSDSAGWPLGGAGEQPLKSAADFVPDCEAPVPSNHPLRQGRALGGKFLGPLGGSRVGSGGAGPIPCQGRAATAQAGLPAGSILELPADLEGPNSFLQWFLWCCRMHPWKGREAR